MRHPFDGIIVPEKQQEAPTASANQNRRSLLKVLAGAVAGLFGFASASRAQTQQKGVLSLVLGEAGGTALSRAFKEEAGDPTKDPTKMRGEEGGPSTDARNEEGGRVTTFALGEEGATRRVGEDGGGRVTTRAVGEEGGRLTKALNEDGGPRATTLAIGEEGGQKIPQATTNALGEEGGQKVPQVTTFAVGEEGGN